MGRQAVQLSGRSGTTGALGRLRFAGRIEGFRGVPVGAPRRYDGYAVIYLFDGSGYYRDPAHDVAISAGTLIYVTPGHPHWYGVPDDRQWDEVFLAVEGPVFELAHARGLFDTRRPLRRLAPRSYWLERIDAFRLRRAPVTTAGVDDEACDVMRLLVEIAARAESLTPAEPVRRPRGWLASSQAALAEDLAEPVDLAAVAAGVGLHYETWRKRFQAETGLPPARWRVLRKIEAAEELLRRTSMSASDIALTVGFSDSHHLAKVFRATTGMTTSEFRRSMV